MSTIIFVLCVMAVVSFVVAIIVAGYAMDLEEKLKKANAEYRALEKKYQTVRRYCIKDSKHVPCGKYFVVGWLNMMQDIHTEKWYYISDEDQRKLGCDVDGDIINITYIERLKAVAKARAASKEDVYKQLGETYADMLIHGASKEECQTFIKDSIDIIDSYKEDSE